MDALPIFINLKNRRCVVIGGGEVAARKVNMLLKTQAVVEVVSPELCSELAALVADERIAHIEARFAPEQLDGAVIAIAATDDASINRAASMAAVERNIPVNVVDAPALCTFTMP
ncbi:MAG TPA: bifunctional precorrin-2 dehydrogenase/sirohydrochlorin ferrochelatase, partial [Methylophilaceae bacterium]|nr:bifunctional precorrin-2 dehydrogenase/sirohydrochlorin ferrochelatase [Methylophilaceae bacterium]